MNPADFLQKEMADFFQWKSRKAEIRQKKMAEKSTRKKQSKVSTEINVSDSEPTESGVQSNEIFNN